MVKSSREFGGVSSSSISAGLAAGAAAHATTVAASPGMPWAVAALRTGGRFRPFLLVQPERLRCHKLLQLQSHDAPTVASSVAITRCEAECVAASSTASLGPGGLHLGMEGVAIAVASPCNASSWWAASLHPS